MQGGVGKERCEMMMIGGRGEGGGMEGSGVGNDEIAFAEGYGAK